MNVLASATVDNWIGLGLAIGLLVFLVIVLVFPERF
jgi:K+-transporting ATPase KdpF subunit